MSEFRECSEAVLRRAASGDLDAFEAIYKASSGFVYRIAYRILQNRTDAEDVMQDVFVKLYAHLREFRAEARFTTWLYRVTVNTALNRAEKNSRDALREIRDASEAELPSVPPSAPGQLEKQEAEETLSMLLKDLSPEYRACLILREIEGLDYRTIAETLQINLNTVRTRLMRARETLAAKARKGKVVREL